MMRKFTGSIELAKLVLMFNQIQTLTVPGEDAVAELEKLRKNYARIGLYPVMLGNKEDVEFNATHLSGRHNVQHIISEGLATNTTAWFDDIFHDLEEDAEFQELFEGDWPEEVTRAYGLSIPNDLLTGQPEPEIIIGLLDIENPWEAFAALNWGGWNACPKPAEHCAVHRYWYDKYGAEVVGITTDVVECIVTRPPLTREISLSLAKEHYAYCADIVDQGVGEISTLAATLMTSHYWYFWWD